MMSYTFYENQNISKEARVKLSIPVEMAMIYVCLFKHFSFLIHEIQDLNCRRKVATSNIILDTD